jgi:hypothetical protein
MESEMKLGNLIALPFALVADTVSLGQAGVTRRIMQDERNERDIEAMKAIAPILVEALKARNTKE